MESSAHSFKENARRALGDAQLKRAMSLAKSGFIDKRAKAAAKEFNKAIAQATAPCVGSNSRKILDMMRRKGGVTNAECNLAYWPDGS